MAQNIIACLYDCDGTLIPGWMQTSLLTHYGVEPRKFWEEANGMVEKVKKEGINLNKENAYLNLIIDYAEAGIFSDLSNAKLRELGAQIKVFPGLPEFFFRMKRLVEEELRYTAYNISLENYIISTGLKEMILGSILNQEGALDGVFASEFLERGGLVKRIARSVGYTEKTKYLYEINKGANINPEIDINERLPKESRRIPFENMIYVGDGFTDVPCFALINDRGGKSIAVYDPALEKAFPQAYHLREEERVFAFSPADYSAGSETSRILELTVKEMAEGIIRGKK